MNACGWVRHQHNVLLVSSVVVFQQSTYNLSLEFLDSQTNVSGGHSHMTSELKGIMELAKKADYRVCKCDGDKEERL